MREHGRRRWGVGVALGVALLLAGCALEAPRPAPDAPQDDPGVVAIQSAGDVGALGCAIIITQGSAEDVRKATLAAAAARSVLSDPQPSFQKLQRALQEGMPPKYAIVSTVIVQRLKARLGQADLIPSDTTAWAMAEQFVASCQEALGSTASVDLPWINDTLDRIALSS